MFAKEIYTARRAKLRQSVGSGIILLIGNDESPMNYADNGYHFRQDSTFLYFFGLSHPQLAGIIDCDTGDDFIFGDDLTIDDYVWTGPQPTIALLALATGVEKTADTGQLVARLRQLSATGAKIHYLPPYRAENKLKLFRWLGIHPDEAASGASHTLRMGVINLRNYKQAEEIAELDRACSVSVDMHTLAMRLAKPGVKESVIAAAVEQLALADGGHTSFPVIATINGQTLHNHYHGNTLEAGRLFLLDAGAETERGYAGDLSSTVPVSGRFTSRQHDIYSLCLQAHNAAIELLRPGMPFIDVYFETCRTIVRGMKDLGLMKGNVDDAVMNGAHALFFPCGLGHMMGLDVHDMEDLGEVYVGYDGQPKSTQFGLKSLRLGRKLEPGFVLTIEPGIYFIPQLIDQWQAKGHNAGFINYDKLAGWKDFGGLRNEEDFLITGSGYRLLGKPKPKTIEEVLTEWGR